MKDKLKVYMVEILFILVGLTTNVYAQERFVLIQTVELSNYYLDTARVQLFSISKFRDGWVKRTFVSETRLAEPSNWQRNEAKKKVKKNKNVSYQLIHEQFDPINSQYKVLETYLYDDHSQVLFSNTVPTPWLSLIPGSVEEQVLKSIDEYFERNPAKVLIR